MVNWQVTATTLLCPTTHTEVTVMVYKDGTVKCTGEHGKNGDKRSHHRDCSALDCQPVRAYYDRLMSEEASG